jgi:thioredoxin-related protein
MLRKVLFIFVPILVFGAFAPLKAAALDSVPLNTVVFVEGQDADGEVISRGTGVIVKKGFVAANYHVIAGMAKVVIYKYGEDKEYVSDGYLAVEETKDVIIISVPGISGNYARLSLGPFPEEKSELKLVTQPSAERIKVVSGIVSGTKELEEWDLPEVTSRETEDFTNGPVFYNGEVAGFCTAGYLDERYFAYIIPAYETRRMMNRSFIIKNYNSLRDTKPMKSSTFQVNLMENLEAVLWMRMEDAERLARNKKKMIVVHFFTQWAGWGKLMDKNTYSKKRIIRYVNENFYAVRMNAESTDTIAFNKLAYTRNIGSPYHTLAYSLLEGNMEFPSTVFLDEEVNLLLVIPGYMDADKMDVVLHYFSERAYFNEKLSFFQYEQEFRRRRPDY